MNPENKCDRLGANKSFVLQIYHWSLSAQAQTGCFWNGNAAVGCTVTRQMGGKCCWAKMPDHLTIPGHCASRLRMSTWLGDICWLFLWQMSPFSLWTIPLVRKKKDEKKFLKCQTILKGLDWMYTENTILCK